MEASAGVPPDYFRKCGACPGAQTCGDQVARATEWAVQNGWKPLINSAIDTTVPGGKKASSAGVAIFARDGIGLRRDDVVTSKPERLIGSIIECPAHPPLSVVSAYLRDGCGMTGLNATLLSEACAHAANGEYAGIIGGDFQNNPATMKATGALDDLGGVIISPGPTCSVKADNSNDTAGGRTRMSTIDYFVVHGGIDAAIAEASVLNAKCIKTHRVVQISFLAALAELRRKELRKPSALPLEKVYGPMPPAIVWERGLDAATTARDSAFKAAQDCKLSNGETLPLCKVKSSLEALSTLHTAMQTFSDLAEQEIIIATGADVQNTGNRAKVPTFVQAPLTTKI